MATCTPKWLIAIIGVNFWSETTLNYEMTVERHPTLKEGVGGSIPNCEISSLLDTKIVK